MEATVNVNVKVSLEEATIQRIREIFAPRLAGIEARPAQGPRPAVPEKPREAAKPGAGNATTSPENATTSGENATTSAPAAAPINNMTLMNAVKAAKDKSGPDAVRAIFATFGIAASRDCPEERRAELLEKLKSIS